MQEFKCQTFFASDFMGIFWTCINQDVWLTMGVVFQLVSASFQLLWKQITTSSAADVYMNKLSTVQLNFVCCF